jgi:glucosamine-6-phosphate deaminase
MSVMSDILHRPEIVVLTDAEAAARAVAKRIAAAVAAKPDVVLGLATGNTPRRVYDLLVEAHAQRRLSFARVTSFNLDEYCGLPADHPSTFLAYMREKLFSLVDIDASKAHLPDGSAVDPDAVAAAYEASIAKAGGIDLQLLGIGQNGHIGFNEPGSSAISRTRLVSLSPLTLAANAADFPSGEMPPPHAITMGIATILDAREIILLATGAGKAAALEAAINGPVSENCPASFLRLHPHVTIVCDIAAYPAAAPQQQSR